MADTNNGAATLVPLESPILRRRNSITATSAAAPSLDIISLKSPFSSYISLRDVLPSPNAAINSPSAAALSNSGYEISIRNRLVKQAAWAYLQPMSNSPSTSSAPHFLRRVSASCLTFLFHHLVPAVARFLRRLFHALCASHVRL